MVLDIKSRLTGAITKQIEKVIYISSAENISPNLAVHEIRKSFKRIRALLKFYKSPDSILVKSVSEQLCEFGKILSPIRDSYVVLQISEKVTNENKLISEQKLKSVKDKLADKNKNFIQINFIDNDFRASILNFMDDFKSKLENNFDHPGKDKIINVLKSSFIKSYNFFNTTGFSDSPEELHHLRKRLKNLWYQTEFIKFAKPKYFNPKSKQLHEITEHLGDDHDLYLFLKEIKSKEYNLYQLELEVFANQVRHLRELNLHKLQPRLKHFFTESPEAFEEKINSLFEGEN